MRCMRYGGEPYALSGDIPAVQKRVGCMGWSLYTGSAAWMYRTAVQTILGIRKQGDKLRLSPHISEKILPLKIKIVINHTEINVKIEKSDAKTMRIDGKEVDAVPLDGSVYQVILR